MLWSIRKNINWKLVFPKKGLEQKVNENSKTVKPGLRSVGGGTARFRSSTMQHHTCAGGGALLDLPPSKGAEGEAVVLPLMSIEACCDVIAWVFRLQKSFWWWHHHSRSPHVFCLGWLRLGLDQFVDHGSKQGIGLWNLGSLAVLNLIELLGMAPWKHLSFDGHATQRKTFAKAEAQCHGFNPQLVKHAGCLC